MRFLLLSITSVFAIANALTIVRRDASTVVNDIAEIKTQLQDVYEAVLQFQGGPGSTLQALNIQSQSNQVASLLEQGAKDAAASGPFGTTGSANVALGIAGLTPLVFATLDELVAKEQGFTNAALGFSAVGIVESTLQKLKQSTDDFGGNVTARLDTQSARLAPLIVGEINYHFVQSLQAYSS